MTWHERDASFWKCPDTVRPKKMHLLRAGTSVSLCGGVSCVREQGDESPPESRKCKRCLRMSAKDRRVRVAGVAIHER